MKMPNYIFRSLILMVFPLVIISCESKMTVNVDYNFTADSEDLSDEKFEELKAILIGAIEPLDHAKYDCSNQGDTFIFTVTQEGNADICIEALDGDTESIELWNSKKKIYDNASLKLYEIAKEAGLGITFRFCVINDENTEKALLIYDDSVCVYDPVNNIDELDNN